MGYGQSAEAVLSDQQFFILTQYQVSVHRVGKCERCHDDDSLIRIAILNKGYCYSWQAAEDEPPRKVQFKTKDLCAWCYVEHRQELALQKKYPKRNAA